MHALSSGRGRAVLAKVQHAGRSYVRQVLTVEWWVRAVSAGLIAGLLAGIAMPLLALFVAVAAGESLWAPPRAIASMFFGQPDADNGIAVAVVAAGTGMHLLLSAGFGIMFALVTGLTRRTLTVRAQLVAGLLWGLGRWATNTFVIAPQLPGGQVMTAAMPAWTWLVGHLLYGAILGLLHAQWWEGPTVYGWLQLAAVRVVVGAFIVELAVLLCGWLLFAFVSPSASFAFAGVVILGAVLGLRQSMHRDLPWARYGGAWALVGGLVLLLWNTLRVS